MGLRFDFQAANWVAYLLQPGAHPPSLGDTSKERETLLTFLRRLPTKFYSSERHAEKQLNKYAWHALHSIANENLLKRISHLEYALSDIKRFLGDRPWKSLIIPSWEDKILDSKLCSEEFLKFLIHVRPYDPGLILQIEEPEGDTIALLDVFPAFRTALADSMSWPGILIWTSGGDSIYLPFGTKNITEIEKRAHWIFSNLEMSIGLDLGQIKSQYLINYPDVIPAPHSVVHFLHISDLHIGSKEASLRMPRIQQIIGGIFEEYGAEARIIPIVSGDLMDSPNEKNRLQYKSFIEFMAQISHDNPVWVLGNHDVRKGGFLNEKLRAAMQLSTQPINWYDDEKVGLVCFNSVIKGKLARGYIGESQLIDIGNIIDKKKGSREYILLGMLHHHPIPVKIPEWYARPFIERIIGTKFEETESLEDATTFLKFVGERGIAALMHGHKHIPRIDRTNTGCIILGCGSSVGKVSTTDGGVYMSVNIVSVENRTGKIVGRLLAERIPGGGLVEEKRHEVIVQSRHARKRNDQRER